MAGREGTSWPGRAGLRAYRSDCALTPAAQTAGDTVHLDAQPRPSSASSHPHSPLPHTSTSLLLREFEFTMDTLIRVSETLKSFRVRAAEGPVTGHATDRNP